MSILDEFQTRREVAEEFRVSKATIRLWEKNYGLPVLKLGIRCLYDPQKTREWFLSHQRMQQDYKDHQSQPK